MKKRILSLILCLSMIICTFNFFQITAFAQTISFPHDYLTVNVGETIYPTFAIVHENVMIYDYTVVDSNNKVIATKTYEYQPYAASPSYGSFTIPKAGTYRIYWTTGGYDVIALMSGYNKRANNRNVSTVYQTFTAVGEAPVVPDAVYEDEKYIYDGTPKSIKVKNAAKGSVVSYAKSENDYGAMSIYSPNSSPKTYTNAGTYNVYAFYNESGSGTSLWQLLKATLTILPKDVSISNLNVKNKIYDGTTNAEITFGELSGVIEGDDVVLADAISGKFADKNVGNQIEVSLNEDILIGTDSGNYTFTQKLRANISPAPLKIKARDIKIEKGTKIPELTYDIVEGELYGDDKLSGSLNVDANKDIVGDYAITLGTLTAGENYSITFVPGTLSVKEREKQNVSVETTVSKTYGDAPFKVGITDNNPELGNFIYTSSNNNVATISNEGLINIKNAGETEINIAREGNNDYAPFEKTWTLTVNKAKITVTADVKSKRIGTNDPELTYTYTGTLVGTDKFTGELTRQSGESIGKYDILQGTLALSDNYNITYNKAIFEIVDKIPQNVGVDGIVTEKTYGDEGFKITVTPDENSNLDNFEITSSNTDVAIIDESGNVTIKNAGTTIISVKEPGNADYAPFVKTWTLTVNKVAITVTADAKSKRVGTADPALTYTHTGNLVGTDAFTGELTRQTGETVGKYDILQGTLALSNNYVLTYNRAIFDIVDKEPQNITVSTITEKTYGDTPFTLTVTPDATSGLSEFIFESSNTDVADISNDGTVTIKSAGKTNITVKQPGNADYAEFVKTQELVVNKVDITVTADAKSKRVGTSDPDLTYQYTGNLVGEDAFTGELTRQSGEEVGTYDILQGTLTLTDNYNITYNKATFKILEKTPQNIVIADIDAKTYGDSSFAITVTPDENSKLDTFTYVSSNVDVADVAADGTVTIKGAGETTITVSQAGNDEYAATEKSVKVIVNPITVAVTAIDMGNKTAAIEGILDADKDSVELDFDNVKTIVISSEKSTVEEATTITSTLKVTNFTFKGEKAKNYVADKSASLTTTVATTTVAEKLTEDENVTIEAAPVDDKTIIVTDVAVAPESEVKKVTIDVTAIADTKVNTVALPKTTVDTIIGIDAEASLEITLKDGSAENKESTITLNAQALAAIQTAGSASTTLSISVNKTEKEELGTEQAAKFDEVSTKTPVVYSLSIVDEAGNSVASSFGDAGKATVTLPYAKPAGNGNVIVKYLDDLGNLTNISNPKYDAATQTVTVELAHFSEYLIYTEPVRSSGGGGGGVSKYTVKFETNGGTAIKSVSVNKNAVATEPTAPTKEGFKFDGWYTDKELTTAYDFTAKVTKNFTLYAKWTEIEKEPVVDEPDTTITFTDVKKNDWFYENVKYVVENKLMNGVAENEFAPNDTLTRAMLVTVLYRNAGEPAVNKSIPFADVDMGSWYANAVVWAKQNGIVNGVNETEFAPDANITREQIATIMFRYAQYKGMDAVTLEENLHFTDADEISEFAVSAMNWAVGTGLINGKSATTLNPKDNATRAEIAAILQRFIEANK